VRDPLEGDENSTSVTHLLGDLAGPHVLPDESNRRGVRLEPFPCPFAADFENQEPGDTARFFSDQKGTFEVATSAAGGSCLAQIVPAEGILWYDNSPLKPHTLFGDVNWQDVSIDADVFLAGGDVEIGGRYADRNKLGYRWILTRDGRWQLNWQYTALASGQLGKFKPAAWHHLRLELQGDRISGFVDGKPLAAVTDRSRAKGMAFLASTYDRKQGQAVNLEHG